MRLYRSALLPVLSSLVLVLLIAGCGDKSQPPPSGVSGDIAPGYTEDIRMYEQALAADPNNKDILIQIGNKYFDWGEQEVQTMGDKAQPVPKWLKGIDYYKRALAIDPSNVDVRTDMAILMSWIGQFDEAEKEYRTGININPRHPQARINLIILLGGSMGRYADAIKEYDALLKAVPDQKNNTGLKEAVEGYRKALKEAKK
jgi:tetratricopeptide (TPR) repeat protein